MGNEDHKVLKFFSDLFKENAEHLEKTLEDQMCESTAELYNRLDNKASLIETQMNTQLENIKADMSGYKEQLLKEMQIEMAKSTKRGNSWFWTK